MTARRHGESTDVRSTTNLGAPLDLTPIHVTHDLFENLSARRFLLSAGSREAEPLEGEDPTTRLLQSLITDIDQGSPPLSLDRKAAPSRRSRRRGARTIVTISVTTAVLATTGVAAAAGGGLSGPNGPSARPSVVAEQPAEFRIESKSMVRSVRGDTDDATQGSWDRTAPPGSDDVTVDGKLKRLHSRFGGVSDRRRKRVARLHLRAWSDWRERDSRGYGDVSERRTTVWVYHTTTQRVRKLGGGFR